LRGTGSRSAEQGATEEAFDMAVWPNEEWCEEYMKGQPVVVPE
jgi:hypothetical protein